MTVLPGRSCRPRDNRALAHRVESGSRRADLRVSTIGPKAIDASSGYARAISVCIDRARVLARISRQRRFFPIPAAPDTRTIDTLDCRAFRTASCARPSSTARPTRRSGLVPERIRGYSSSRRQEVYEARASRGPTCAPRVRHLPRAGTSPTHDPGVSVGKSRLLLGHHRLRMPVAKPVDWLALAPDPKIVFPF
jgi:hypothetical protein